MSETVKHSRRAALGALASVPALAIPAGAIAAPSTTAPAHDLANKLWARRHALRQPYIDAWQAISRAEAQFPEWERPELRLRAHEAERARLGLPDLDAARNLIDAQRQAIGEQIEELEPDTPNAAAARILLEVAIACNFREPFFYYDEGGIAEVALTFLRPSARRGSRRALQSSISTERKSDDCFDFPPTAHPGRELLTMSLFALSIIALVAWVGWRLISLI